MPYKDREAQRRYAADHYAQNRDAYKARARAYTTAQRERLVQVVATAKAGPCTDCRTEYPHYVMQFDHIGDDKEANVADMAHHGVSVERILAEIAKCQLVCANCHAARTHRRRVG